MKFSAVALGLAVFGSAIAGPVDMASLENLIGRAAMEEAADNELMLQQSQAALVKRQYSNSSTASDLANGDCRALTFIFARGTFEPGNIGGVVGPPLAQALADGAGASNVAVQGVEYSANVVGYIIGGDPTGASNMDSFITQAQTKCPSTKLSIGGYSQGAQVLHNAVTTLSASAQSFITSVVVFGDPFQGTAIGSIPESKILRICHAGDNICNNGGPIINSNHLDYANDVPQASQFILSKAGF